MSSRRRASEEQIPPNSGASNEPYIVAGSPSKKKPRMLPSYNPALEVATATIDPDLDTYPETALGKFEVLQTVESNGQGYYLHCNKMRLRGYIGPTLLKYLGEKNAITRQYQASNTAAQTQPSRNDVNADREIQFAGQLNHENIVRILGFISPNGRPDSINAIIMEGKFTDGILEAYASRKQIPLPLVKAFALQLASALEYCHSLGIMHRDVRTRNIYVEKGMIIKLGNFGYARVGDKNDNNTSNKCEEPYYQALEMFSSNEKTKYGLSVDVYGFALVLWSMLHGGKKPFKNELDEKAMKSETKIRKYIENEEHRPKFNEDVDHGLAVLIKRCWINETEIDKRPSMSEVVQELQRLSLSLLP